MTAKTWSMLLRVTSLVAVAIGVIAIAFLGLEDGFWLLLVVVVTAFILALGPNYFQPNSDD